MSDGIPLGPGQWYPDDDSGPDRLAMEAGVNSYSDYADLREFQAEMDDVVGGWDVECIVAIREAASIRERWGPNAERALRIGDVETWVRYCGKLAQVEAIARAWADLADFP